MKLLEVNNLNISVGLTVTDFTHNGSGTVLNYVNIAGHKYAVSAIL